MRSRSSWLSCLLCALAVLAASIALPTPSYAKGSLQITPSDGVERSYSAWKLLAGNVRGGGSSSRTLSDVGFTDAITSDGWQQIGVPSESVQTAQDVADWLAQNETPAIANEIDWQVSASGAKPDVANVTAGSSSDSSAASSNPNAIQFNDLDDGYWLVSSADSSPILVLVGGGTTVKVTEKAEAPTLTKQVRTDGDWSDFAIAGNDLDPQYRLVGTLPKNYDSFPSYHYKFDDTAAAGLTINASSVKVVAESADGATVQDLTDQAKVTAAGSNLTVEFADLKAEKCLPQLGDYKKIVVTYTAHLGASAGIGLSNKNTNDATLTYTRKPTPSASKQAAYDSATVKGTTAGTTAAPVVKRAAFRARKGGWSVRAAAGSSDATSKRQQCEVATWAIRLKKVSSTNNAALVKAGFTVQDAQGLYINTDGTASKDQTSASVWRTGDDGTVVIANLPNGDFTLKEVEVPDGYKAAPDTTVTIKGSQSDLDASTNDAQITHVDSGSGMVDVTVKDDPNGSGFTPGASSGGAGASASSPLAKAAKLVGGAMPKTGDPTSMGIAVLLLAMGACAITMAVLMTRKGRKRNDNGQGE